MVAGIVAAASKIAEVVKIKEIAEVAQISESSELGKKTIEPSLDIAKNMSLESITQFNLENGFERIATRNQHLEGKPHPETGVPFIAKIIENDIGQLVEVVVPEFPSIIDVQLPDELLQATDNLQFAECNRQLKETVENNPDQAEKFTDEQLQQIKDGETPDGYTWHHDAEKGKMQLVNERIHAQTGHTGGKHIWGGGNINR